MRHALANSLRRLANWIHNDEHHDTVEIVDEWSVCRCRLGIATDETHGVDSEFTLLPDGWRLESHREE